jgi:hypothetical protein
VVFLATLCASEKVFPGGVERGPKVEVKDRPGHVGDRHDPQQKVVDTDVQDHFVRTTVPGEKNQSGKADTRAALDAPKVGPTPRQIADAAALRARASDPAHSVSVTYDPARREAIVFDHRGAAHPIRGPPEHEQRNRIEAAQDASRTSGVDPSEDISSGSEQVRTTAILSDEIVDAADGVSADIVFPRNYEFQDSSSTTLTRVANRQQQRFLVDMGHNILVPRSLDYHALMNAYERAKINRRSIKVFSLFLDTQTRRKVSALGLGDIVTSIDAQDASAQLQEALSKISPGDVAVVMGHFSNGFFEQRDAAGKITLRVSAAELEKQMSARGVRLTAIGCNAGVETPVGAAARFNSLHAMGRLAIAVDANNYGNFLRELASAEMPIVIDDISYRSSGRFVAKGTVGARSRDGSVSTAAPPSTEPVAPPAEGTSRHEEPPAEELNEESFFMMSSSVLMQDVASTGMNYSSAPSPSVEPRDQEFSWWKVILAGVCIIATWSARALFK